jgi:hypothetical protein
MKNWYVYKGSTLVDVIQAYSADSAIRQARDRGTYAPTEELTAISTIK